MRDDLRNTLEDLCEYSIIEIIKQQSANVIMISLYRPPDTDLTLFDTKLSKFLQYVTKNLGKKKMIIAADWNIDFLKLNSNTKIDQFLINMESFGLVPSITVPTRITERSATLLDNILTNCVHEEYYTRVIYDDISDHLPVFININLKSSLVKGSIGFKITTYMYSQIYFLKFKNLIKNEDWLPLTKHYINSVSQNQAYCMFDSKFKKIFDESFIVKSVNTDSPKNTNYFLG